MPKRAKKKRGSPALRGATLALETLMLMLAGVYFLLRTASSSTFFLTIPAWVNERLPYAVGAVAALHLLCVAPRRRSALLSLPLAAIYYLIFRMTGHRIFLYFGEFTVGFAGIDYRKLFKTHLLTAGVLFCVVMIAGVTGTITNFIYPRQGFGIRSARGMSYPTDFASLALYLTMFLWVAWEALPDWAMLFLCAPSILLSRFVAYSSTSFYCGILFACAVLYRGFERRVVARHPRLRWVERGSGLLLQAAFPALALAMFGLMFVYSLGTGFGYRLDSWLSGRLHYAVDAWRAYGIKPFGTMFAQHGGGFSVVFSDNYNFVDSSYPLILIRYGWVTFATMCAVWCWGTHRAIAGGNKRLALVMGVIAFHSFSEHHFSELLYNLPLAAVFAACGVPRRRKGRARRGSRRSIAGIATAILASAALWFAGPGLLTWLKTIFEIKGLTGGHESSWIVIPALLGLAGVAALSVWAVFGLLYALLNPRASAEKPLVALAACAVVVLCGVLYCDTEFRAEALKSAELLDADERALEIIEGAATGEVYSNVMPAVYRRRFPGISLAPLSGEELARYRGATVLMDSAKEYRAFIACNYLYSEISDRHAVYTSDAGVIEALQEAGYHLTGYYSTEGQVDLKARAEKKNLIYSEEKGVQLRGKQQSLKKGPYFTLYGGDYTATYELLLPKKEVASEGKLCTLQVCRNKGETVLAEVDVSPDQFGEDGLLTVNIPLSIEDSAYVDFRVLVEKGRRINVRRISYRRTPAYDVHRFYDSKMRLVREEYYDTDGAPLAQPAGYYSYEQSYDRAGNIAARRFCNADGEPVLRTDGYAEVRWQYDAKRQVVGEAFFDAQGLPVMISSRQASNEREYDEAGNVVAWRYYDTEGAPTVTTYGYAMLYRGYDEEGRLVRESYCGADGEPMAQSGGYSSMEQSYDGAGNVAARRFLFDGAPILRTDGYAEVRWTYNGLRQIVREEFCGLDGRLAMNSDGQAANEREYDDEGNVTVYRYYGADGAPVLYGSGYAEVRRRYNGRRLIVYEAYYGTDGQPIVTGDGYAAVAREYNELSLVNSQRYFGTSGEPTLCAGGYHEFRREFDGSGNAVAERYYDGQGLPVACDKGYAYVLRAYDDRDEMVEESFYNADDTPAAVGPGYTRALYEYDGDRQLMLSRYYDAFGEPVQAGSGYLHDYLQSLKGRDLTVLIAAKDEATNGLTPALLQDLRELGIRTDLRGRYRNAFYAVISPEGVIEDVSAQGVLSASGSIGDVEYAVTSAGYQVGNYSSIVVDGVEYAQNARGLNVVVYDNAAKEVADSVAFDTYTQEMAVTR